MLNVLLIPYRVPAEVACNLSFKTMESAMLKARRKFSPAIPETIEEYGKLLRDFSNRYETVDGEPFFSGVVGEPGNSSAVFIVQPLMYILCNSNEWHVDGTFKTVPGKPHAHQLFTIMAVYHDHVSTFTVSFYNVYFC